MRGRVTCLAVVLAISTPATSARPGQADPAATREYQIKAAFLYNFARFVEWPDEAFTDSGASLVLCVLGQDPFGEALESVQGKDITGRMLEIRRFAALQDLGPCHILFIGSSEQERLAEVFESVENFSVLTVGDVDRFARMGGVINFIIRANKIRFLINLRAGERAGLAISSQLLNLAEIVDTDTRPEQR